MFIIRSRIFSNFCKSNHLNFIDFIFWINICFTMFFVMQVLIDFVLRMFETISFVTLFFVACELIERF